MRDTLLTFNILPRSDGSVSQIPPGINRTWLITINNNNIYLNFSTKDEFF